MFDFEDLKTETESFVKVESSEKTLILAIIDISIKDLSSKIGHLRIDAFDYFFSKTFELHCELAGIEPCRVRKRIQDKLDFAMSTKAERGMKIKDMREMTKMLAK